MRTVVSIAAVVAVLFATAVRADSVFTLSNYGTLAEVKVNAFVTGHSCWTSSADAAGSLEFTTSTNADCIINLNKLVLAAAGNPFVNCSVLYDGELQLNPATGKDAWVAGAIITDIDSHGHMCALSAVAAVGNTTQPVSTYTTCRACSGMGGQYSQDSVFTVGTKTVTAYAYTSAFSSSSCASNDVTPGVGNYWTCQGGLDGDDCTSPVTMLSLQSQDAATCNVTISPSAPHVGTFITGVVGDAVCVQPAVVPAALTLSYSGPCPSCTGL